MAIDLQKQFRREQSGLRAEYDRIVQVEQRALQQRGRPISIHALMQAHGFVDSTEDKDESVRRRSATGPVLSSQVAEHHYVPQGFTLIGLDDGRLTIGSAGDYLEEDLDRVSAAVQAGGFDVEKVHVELWSSTEIAREAKKRRSVSDSKIEEVVRALEPDPSNGQLLTELYKLVIHDGFEARASDIHIIDTPDRDDAMESWISHRVNGQIRHRHLLPSSVMRPLATRLKQVGGCKDFASRERPQDGRLGLTWQGREVDVRLAATPLTPGEEVSLRLLDRATIKPFPLLFARLPAAKRAIERLLTRFAKQAGVMLICGATGSGKSTSQASIVIHSDRASKRVFTIEHPKEYRIPWVRQMEVADRDGCRWGDYLEHAMRKDFDILFTGETRDGYSAEVGVQAAETGHLFGSTTHSEDCGEGIERFISNFSDRFMRTGKMVLGKNLRVVIHQKLAPTVCPACRNKVSVGDLDGEMRKELIGRWRMDVSTAVMVSSPAGCEACDGTGIGGRTLSAETMVFPTDPDGRRRVVEAVVHDQLFGLAQCGVEHLSRSDHMGGLVRDGLVEPKWGLDLVEG